MANRQPSGLAEAAIAAGKPLIAAIYNRVSQDKRKKAKSVGEQDAENREACEEQGWTIGYSFGDNDVSASRFSTKAREDWALLLAILQERRFHVLVLWEVSRADRKLSQWVHLIDTCRDLGVLIHVTSQERTYDVRNDGDWKSLIDEGVAAAHEPERTSKRVKRDVRATARAGKPHGRILYGYRREYGLDDRGNRIMTGQFIDDTPREATGLDGTVTKYTRAGVVREAADRIAAGEAGFSIARDFNERGIPTPQNSPNGWSQTQIRDTVINPAYVGRRVHQGVPLEGVTATWPPILDVVIYETCVAIFSDPARRRENSKAVKYLGSGLFCCGVCGGIIRVDLRRGNPTYTCRPRPTPPKGQKSYHVGRTLADVDEYVQRSVWLRLARDDMVDLLAEDARADERMAAIAAEITEKQGRLDAARDGYAASGAPIEGLLRIEAALQPEIAQLRARLHEARIGPVLRGLVGVSLPEIEAEWWRRSLPERREVLRALITSVEILPVGRSRNTFQRGVRAYTPQESVRIVWRG